MLQVLVSCSDQQEAQLLQRDCAVLHAIKYFTKSFKVIKIVLFESLGTVSYLHSIVTMAVFPRCSEVLVENRDFFIPPCIRRPAREVPVRILP